MKKKTAPNNLTDQFWFNLLLAVGFWTIIALLETFQIYMRFLPDEYEILEEGRKISWIQWTLRNVPRWYILAFSTPVIFWLGQRFSFEGKSHKWKTFLIHLSLSFLFAALYLALESVFARLITGFPINSDTFVVSFTNRLKLYFHLIVASYWAILGAGFALDFYFKYRERRTRATELALLSSTLETKLVKAQLDSLKMQLHPHFLFNTLHAISALIEDDPKIARDMLVDLSELLRFTLDAVERQTISLKQEVEITKLYLGIEQQRFKDKLQADFQVKTDDFEVAVPSFILQPLVENSIKHGINGEKRITKIQIKTSRLSEKFQIIVEDNGKGFSKESLEKEVLGIGLSNTKARLDQLYNNEHQFKIQNSITGGAIVKIIIPLNREENLDDNK